MYINRRSIYSYVVKTKHSHPLFFVICMLLILSGACQKNKTEKVDSVSPQVDLSIYQTDNLVAWCVVPFDSMNRGPAERVKMLADLGFKKFAYDWREKHLPSFPQEVELLEQQQIELLSVWWWVDGHGDQLLNEGNEQLLHYLDSLNIRCDIWMSFSDDFFQGLDDAQKLERAVESLKKLHQKAADAGCNLMLYNHGSWFGDPRNQVRIIEESGLSDVGIIYNFHHAHQQIEEFPEILEAMLPYLNTVNINGMNKGGPKTLTVGQGESEKEMLRMLAASGFKGHVGIIGHIEQEDVKVVLERNIKGLQQVASEL